MISSCCNSECLDQVDRFVCPTCGAWQHKTEDVICRESMWTTQDGDMIPITKMNDQHLLNTIRVLRGRSHVDRE